MKWEAVIGLEVHAQLTTATKIFCGCSTAFGAEPNTQTCPVCLGHPGVLPVLNRRVLEYAVLTGIAMHCRIRPYSRFARKNYFYPDLPKGYQVSQFELPICEGGYLDVEVEGELRRIGITRIHMEEDAGKNIHGEGGGSVVDLNRAGVPLLEIVSEPDVRSAKEAAGYMRTLRTLLRYLGVCDGNMEQGSLRCDANVSVRPAGATEYGTRAEVKNINSFRFVERAVDYEIARQIDLIEAGGAVVQETRLWDSERGVTESMRSKEEAHDYRYFPEPDLVPIAWTEEQVGELARSLPELPWDRKKRFMSAYGLSPDDAERLVEERAVADWFEATVTAGARPRTAANWIFGDWTRLMNSAGLDVADCPVNPDRMAALLKLVDGGTISGNAAKTVFEEMFETGKGPDEIVEARGLVQISDAGELEAMVDRVIESHPAEVERFRGGETKLLGFLVGQVMKESRGKANPKAVNELFRNKLTGPP